MQKRSPIAVILLSIVTFGIYVLYWEVKTKGELNRLGAEIPTAWLIIVPLVNIWWLWKYSEGVEKVTGGKLNTILAFILLWVLGAIGIAIIQDSFNNNVSPASPLAAASPIADSPTMPTETAPGPESTSTETATTVEPPVPSPTPQTSEQPPSNPEQ